MENNNKAASNRKINRAVWVLWESVKMATDLNPATVRNDLAAALSLHGVDVAAVPAEYLSDWTVATVAAYRKVTVSKVNGIVIEYRGESFYRKLIATLAETQILTAKTAAPLKRSGADMDDKESKPRRKADPAEKLNAMMTDEERAEYSAMFDRLVSAADLTEKIRIQNEMQAFTKKVSARCKAEKAAEKAAAAAEKKGE